MSTISDIIQIESMIERLLDSALTPLARKHLARALPHVREAYISEDGQNTRSVDQLSKMWRKARR